MDNEDKQVVVFFIQIKYFIIRFKTVWFCSVCWRKKNFLPRGRIREREKRKTRLTFMRTLLIQSYFFCINDGVIYCFKQMRS
jgi:hypothetical protein